MRVMMLHKVTADTERDAPLPEGLVGRVGGMMKELVELGILRDGAGLRSSARGVRVTFAGGKRAVVPGPFTGENENPAAMCILRVRSIDEAVGHATSFAAVLGDGEVDIRPVTEMWDLGFGEKPKDDPTTRYMLVWKGDAKSERGELPSLQARAAIGKLLLDLKARGIFLQGDVFRPTSQAKRIPLAPGKRRVIDGPFAESKELISGFAVIEIPSVAEAVPYAEKYLSVVKDVECDLRPLYEVAELGR